MSRENPHVVPEEDGLYPNVVDVHYHQWEACSQSGLKEFDRSPDHYRHRRDEDEGGQTKARLIGSAFHMATLQPDEFDRWFVPRPPGHPNSNPYKKRVEEIRAERPFVRILRQSSIDTAKRMTEVVRSHPLAGPLLEGETPELSGVWTDEEYGIRCKLRIDDVAREIGALVDLKSTNDARPDPFGKDAWTYKYYRQAAFYLRGARALGLDVSEFVIIAVEKKPPFGVICYKVPTHLLALAEEELDDLLTRFAWCEQNDEWPSYDDHLEELRLPGWAMKRLEHYLQEGEMVA